MDNSIAKFEMIGELQELGERAFIHKVKERNPDITTEELRIEINRWYRTRPGAEHGDGPGRLVDSSRFR
ncbi:MAG: hypothetical protein WKF34_09575 [Pyrinomonadaceae bacterium]